MKKILNLFIILYNVKSKKDFLSFQGVVKYMNKYINLNQNNIELKNGVSVIVLMVTVIVTIILISSIFLTLKDKAVPETLTEYTARTAINTIKEKYDIAYGKALIAADGRKDKIILDYFEDVVPPEYSSELEATQIGLLYIGTDEKVIEIAKEMDLLIPEEVATEDPNIREVVLTSNINEITVLVKLSENIKDVKNYIYNVREVGNLNWISSDESTSFIYSKSGLKSNTEYEVRVDIVTLDKTYETLIYKIKTEGLAVPTFDNASTDWTNKDITLKINYPKDETLTKVWSLTGGEYDWNKVSGDSYNLLVQKNTTVYAKTIYGKTNSEIVTKKITNIDKLEPNEFTPTIVTKTSNSVTVNGVTTDQNATSENGSSGIKGYMFSKDSGSTWSEEQKESEYVFTNVVDQASMRIQVKAIDNAGNEKISNQITSTSLDMPTPMISATPTDWTNGVVVATVTYEEKTGTTKEYSTDGVNWLTSSSTTQNLSITNNNTTIYARLKDVKKQTSKIATYTVLNIDKTSSEEFTPIFMSKTTNSIQVRGATIDQATELSGTSGLKGYQFRVNGGSWSAIQTESIYNFTNLIQDTEYTIQIKAIDNIGNEQISSDLKIRTYRIPDGNTSLTLTPDKTLWTNTDVLVTSTFPDQANWPYLRIRVSKDNINWVDYTSAVAVSNNNEYVFAKLFDNTNQSGSDKFIQITNIDKDSPVAGTMTMKLGSAVGVDYADNTWTNQSVYLAVVNGSDALSGHNNTTYQVSGANTVAAGTTIPTTLINEGTSTITVTTRDNVGNVSTRSYTVKIDKTNPVAGTMTMKLGSAAGANYTDNTWTNQSVYLAPINGSDALSGHFTTTYAVSGANTVASTSSATTLVNEGVSTVILTTIDNVGNISTRSYTINIDKTNPIVGTMTMKLGNGASANYIDNTWTEKSVDLVSVNGNDVLSGHNTTTYTVSGANTVASTSAANTIANNGTSAVTITTTDLAGNVSTGTYTVKIDKELPLAGTMIMKLGSSTGANYISNTWTNQSVYVAPINGSDALSGHSITNYDVTGANKISSTITENILPSEGISNATLTTIDNVGNMATRTYTINIDKTLPTVSFGTNGATNVTMASTTATVSDNGGSGVNTCQYVWSTSLTEPVSGWTTFTNGNTLTYNTNGAYYLWIKGTDGAGNIFTTRSNVFIIDNIPPTLPTFTLSPTGWTNGNVSVTINYSADSTTKQYSLDGTNWSKYNNASTVSTNGTTVYARASDDAGNMSLASSTTVSNIDKIAPTIVFGTNGGSVISASTTATVSDVGGSGVSSCQYVWSTSTTAPATGWAAYTNGSTLTYSTNGTYYLWIKGIDGAGNVTNTSSNAFVINNDTTPPTAPTYTLSPSTWTNGNVSVTINYSADSSTKQYSTNGSTWNTYSSAVTITTNGSLVYARAYDTAGNMSSSNTTVNNIDKVVPTISFGTNGGSGTSVSSTATVSDTGGSGVSSCQYIWSSSTTAPASGWIAFTNGQNLSSSTVGTYYLWVKGTDGAGNVTTTRTTNTFTVSAPDTTPPVAPTFTLSPTGWTNGNVSVTINYSADTATKQYSTNGSTWNTYSSAVPVSVSGTTVYARAYDSSSNMSSNSTTVNNIDKTAPTATYNKTYAYNVPAARPKVTISDVGGSGVTAQYVWSTSTTAPTSGWASYTSGTQVSKTGVASGTNWYLWIKATDGAGNVTTVRNDQYYIVPASQASYSVYVSSNGWLSWVSQGATGGYGTKTYSAGWGPLLMEGIKFSLINSVAEYLYFQCHTSNIGWQSTITADGSTQSGNPGLNSGRPTPIYGIEAIRVSLSPTAATKYDISYRVFTPATNSWSSPVTNGADAGVTGQNRPLAGIQVTISEKLSFWN